jgi:hypothetical protein
VDRPPGGEEQSGGARARLVVKEAIQRDVIQGRKLDETANGWFDLAAFIDRETLDGNSGLQTDLA